MTHSKTSCVPQVGYYFEACDGLMWLMAYTPSRQLLPTFFQLVEVAKLGPMVNWELISFHGSSRYEGDEPRKHIFHSLPINSVRAIFGRYRELIVNDFDLGVIAKSPDSDSEIPFVELKRQKYFVFWESEPPYNESSYKAAEALIEGLGGSYESLFELQDDFMLPPAINPFHHQQFQGLVTELDRCQQNRGSD